MLTHCELGLLLAPKGAVEFRWINGYHILSHTPPLIASFTLPLLVTHKTHYIIVSDSCRSPQQGRDLGLIWDTRLVDDSVTQEEVDLQWTLVD